MIEKATKDSLQSQHRLVKKADPVVSTQRNKTLWGRDGWFVFVALSVVDIFSSTMKAKSLF